jgi:hypothetical protein
MTTDRLPKVLLNCKPRGYQISDDPWLDGKTYSLEVRNRPAAYILEEEEEEEEEHIENCRPRLHEYGKISLTEVVLLLCN